VFGGAVTREEIQGLALTADVFEAYDDDVLSNQGTRATNQPTPTNTVSGLFSGLGVAMQYARRGDTTFLQSWASSALRYYPNLKDLTAAHHEIGATFSGHLGRRLTVRGSPYANYSPFYRMQLFPRLDSQIDSAGFDRIAAPVLDLDFTIVRRKSFRYGGNGGINLALSNLSTVGLHYGYARAAFDDGGDNLEVHASGVNFSHRLSQNMSFKTGYTRQVGNYRVPDRYLTQNINLGVDYNKPLSRSRRTFLRFSSGSAIVEDHSGRRMALLGSGSLTHLMGRTWLAQTDYRRSVGYVEGFDRPTFSDSATMSLEGLVSRRVELSMTAYYSTGTVGLSHGSPPYNSYSASGRARAALSRKLATYIEYVFYQYRFGADANRPAGMPERLRRHGVRAGLSLFIPVVE
jgi:hypothetical protein